MTVKIAIAEDNNFLLKAILDKLVIYPDLEVKYYGFNGQELLDKPDKDPNVHLILMDIEMPKMNGIEAVQKVAQKYPQIKMIMLTVFDNDEHIFLSLIHISEPTRPY